MKKEKSLTLGILFAIIAIVLFSAKAIMVKLAYQYNIDSVTLLLFRMLFAFPFYLTIALKNKPLKKEEVVRKDYMWLILFGVLGYYLASLFDFEGLRYLKAGLERIILFVYPTLVIILSWLFFKKRVTRVQFLAILITYLGVVVTFWGEVAVDSDKIYYGALLIFLSALSYAAYLVGSGWLIPKFGVITFTAYSMLVSTTCIFINYSFVGNFDLFNYPMPIYALSFAMAILSTLIPSFLVSMAIDRLGANMFSIFGSLGPVSTITFAYFFLGEQISIPQIIGICIVIVGIFIVSKKR